MEIYIIIVLLVILLISHFYYIYKLEDMNFDELLGFGVLMGVFKIMVLIAVLAMLTPSREEDYIKCINTLPESKVTYCDKYLKE